MTVYYNVTSFRENIRGEMTNVKNSRAKLYGEADVRGKYQITD